MIRTLTSSLAALLLFAGTAAAETKPPDKPATPPKAAKPDTPPKTQKAAVKRVSYSCDGGVTMTVTYPPAAQAKTGRVKIAMKDTTYFVRPVAGGEKWENKTIKLVFHPKGDEATIEREGKPLAEKCKSTKPTT